ncbi:hypothetical protein PS467_07290 [Streptomyces luomodiensis]|uniref:PET hydrolase/cutinase-like domain-containing protein n=1 Tax=Streptomyces luomodiensis TaxID=3026192 RepID=A0ABY9URI4_9ACTN|nr:hypothetical protein [Streptomyces sp. SCA4-21]WNE95162.1 hypothetical protein PS467_07290 [Streptomyces sp. SCA4-21]
MKFSVRAPVLAALSTALVITATAASSLSRPSPTTPHTPPAQAASSASARPAIERSHSVVREPARHTEGSAASYTVFRPADTNRKLPVLVYGNGACRHASANRMIGTHTLVASHGFIVIAVGGFDQPDQDEEGTPEPDVLRDAITWAERENQRKGSSLLHRIDTRRIAVGGNSCGGLEALVAGADPRVASVASLNSGFFADGRFGYGREELKKLHTPTLFVDGGPDDQAHENSRANYDLVDVPAVRATNPSAGHSGLWYGLRDGEVNGSIREEGVAVVVQWLDFTLNGNRTARDYFLGDDCGLCSVAGWQDITAKGFTEEGAR